MLITFFLKKLDKIKKIYISLQRKSKFNVMEYQKDSKGKKMSKYDMAKAMVNTDHSNTPHSYCYYANMYVFIDYYTYEEVQKDYKECFNLD